MPNERLVVSYCRIFGAQIPEPHRVIPYASHQPMVVRTKHHGCSIFLLIEMGSLPSSC